jgi:hypothetical protein
VDSPDDGQHCPKIKTGSGKLSKRQGADRSRLPFLFWGSAGNFPLKFLNHLKNEAVSVAKQGHLFRVLLLIIPDGNKQTIH